MKITLQSLDGHEFLLTLPRDEPGPDHTVEIKHTQRLRGVYDQVPEHIALMGIESDVIVTNVLWHLEHGPLSLAGPAELQGAFVDLLIKRGDVPEGTSSISGSASFAQLKIPAAQLGLESVRVAGHVEAGMLSAKHDIHDGPWQIGASELTLQTFAVNHESFSLSGERLSVNPFSLVVGSGQLEVRTASFVASKLSLELGDLRVRAGSARISGLHVTQEQGKPAVEIGDLELNDVEVLQGARTLRFSRGVRIQNLRYGVAGIGFDRLEIDEAKVAVTGLASLAETPSPSKEPEPTAAPAGPGGRMGIDLPVLDHLQGTISADIKVDLRIPILKRRVATHTLRLGITDGSIDFKRLESGLSLLEDSLLDFKVRGDRLVLEVNVYVTRKPILAWPLDAEGLALAKENRVKLRNLARPILVATSDTAPPPAPVEESKDSGKSSAGLNHLEVRPLDLELRLGGPTAVDLGEMGSLQLGGPDQAAVGVLRLRGSFEHHEDSAPVPGVLSLEAEAIRVGTESLQVGDSRISVGSLEIGSITEGRIELLGVRPSEVHATLRDVAIDTFRLQL